jgi:hypothetical protein
MSVPHESLRARFLKLIVVTSRPSTTSSVLMMKRMTFVVCRKNGDSWKLPYFPLFENPSS